MEYYLNREVFVVAEDEMVTVEIGIHDEMYSLIEHLQTLNPINNLDTKLYHGIITSAEILPSSIKGKKCFILVTDPDTGEGGVSLEGCIFESDCENDISTLAGEIEHIINANEYVTFPIEIENVFVLYGYAIDITLGIDDDDVDDEVIDTCTKIIEEIKHMRKGLNLGDDS